jgi:hypothetical protein
MAKSHGVYPQASNYSKRKPSGIKDDRNPPRGFESHSRAGRQRDGKSGTPCAKPTKSKI